MANIIQLKRGTGASGSSTEPAIGEPVFDTGTGKLYISTDGSTALSAMTAINAGTASSLAADNLTAGDAAVTISTSSGNITLDAAANNSDIIFKGTDGGADTTFLTLSGANAGNAAFNGAIDCNTSLTIGSAVMTEADLEKLDGITNGAGAANKALVLDGSANVASGLAALTASGIITASGFTAGSAVLAESELELLDGLTAGTAIASKVVTTDANIDTTGMRNLTISGELDAASLDISGDADIDGTLEADAITVNGTALAELVSDTVGAMFSSNTETRITATYQDSDNTIDLVVDDMTANDNDDVSVANLKTALASNLGGAATIGDANDTITFGEDVIVTGDLTVSGATTTLDVATLDVTDKNITLNKSSGDSSGSADGAGITIQDAVDASNDATMNWNASGDKFVFSHPVDVTGILTATGTSVFASLDISGDVDVDGTLEADAITVGGTALNTVIAGVTSTNATTAAVATTVTITDNESTNENNPIVFVAGGDLDGGNLGLESDGTTTYNPSTGKITATGFVGALTGDVTGDVTGNTSGTAATVTSGTQAAITTCANLTTVGTIGTGTWNADVIASAKLDADTAHLTTTQTFTGAKTFTANATFGADDTGVDVIFYGATSGKRMTWDESADNLVFTGGASIDGLTLDGGSF